MKVDLPPPRSVPAPRCRGHEPFPLRFSALPITEALWVGARLIVELMEHLRRPERTTAFKRRRLLQPAMRRSASAGRRWRAPTSFVRSSTPVTRVSPSAASREVGTWYLGRRTAPVRESAIRFVLGAFCPIGRVCIDFVRLEGFVILDSPAALDVTSMVSSGPPDAGRIASLDVETVAGRTEPKILEVVPLPTPPLVSDPVFEAPTERPGPVIPVIDVLRR